MINQRVRILAALAVGAALTLIGLVVLTPTAKTPTYFAATLPDSGLVIGDPCLIRESLGHPEALSLLFDAGFDTPRYGISIICSHDFGQDAGEEVPELPGLQPLPPANGDVIIPWDGGFPQIQMWLQGHEGEPPGPFTHACAPRDAGAGCMWQTWGPPPDYAPVWSEMPSGLAWPRIYTDGGACYPMVSMEWLGTPVMPEPCLP